jgi:Spy/CpxP family protein refolding chaperone
MKPAKLSLIAAIVVGGLLAGTSLTSAQSTNENRPQGRRGGMSVDQQLDRMTQALSLTDEQKPKVKAVLEDTAKKRQDLANLDQQERREKGRALMEEQDKKLKDILTADQYEKWQKTRQEFRRNRPGGGGGQGAENKPNSSTSSQ